MPTLHTMGDVAPAKNKKLQYPATSRNRSALLEVFSAQLEQSFPKDASPLQVLEFASGSGEHGLYITEHMKRLNWTFSDFEQPAIDSISAYIADCEWNDRLALLSDTSADVTDGKSIREKVTQGSFDVVLCVNMIHISPWECTLGLFEQAKYCLQPGGLVILYGPYLEDDVDTAEGNLRFDVSLKKRNASWGIRNLRAVDQVAREAGFARQSRTSMPANNLTVAYAFAQE
jgi:cyclopropane fatty-acyl-phospholipid synthase-like methyltransferase